MGLPAVLVAPTFIGLIVAVLIVGVLIYLVRLTFPPPYRVPSVVVILVLLLIWLLSNFRGTLWGI